MLIVPLLRLMMLATVGVLIEMIRSIMAMLERLVWLLAGQLWGRMRLRNSWLGSSFGKRVRSLCAPRGIRGRRGVLVFSLEVGGLRRGAPTRRANAPLNITFSSPAGPRTRPTTPLQHRISKSRRATHQTHHTHPAGHCCHALRFGGHGDASIDCGSPS